MTQFSEREKNRRSFLKYLAASAVLAPSIKSALAASAAELPAIPDDPFTFWPHDPNFAVERPEDAIDVFELEATAYKKVPVAHFAYMETGADSGDTVRANRQDIGKFGLRSRRLRDVRKVDASVDILKTKYNWPFFFCPVGGPAAQHADGFMGAARAAGRHNVAQMMSTGTKETVAQANKERNGTPVIFQLYINQNWEVTKNLVQNAERDGARAVAITIDLPSTFKRTQYERAKRRDSRLCGTCHEIADPKFPKGSVARRVGSTGPSQLFAEAMTEQAKAYKEPPLTLTWDSMKRIRDITKMDVMLKGVMHPQDAETCVKEGFGIMVSNHGGRNEDTTASTISALPDIVAVANGKVPVFIDGGFRRGMDIVKALAMGADMVGFGRPWLWGLGAFGEAGVDRVIQIMQAEIIAAMQQVGAANIKELTPDLVYRSL